MGLNIVIVIFAVFLSTDVCCKNNGGQISRQTLIEDLLDPTIYDPSVPPGKPTNVKIQLIINDTIMENEQASEISGLTTVILHWIDSRLDYSAKASYPSFIIRGSAKLKPWVPDIFILEKREPYITGFGSKNELIVFNRSGNVVFNHRFTTRMLCEMNLDYYPYDEQHCQITLQSYAFTQEDVQLSWLSDNPVMDHVQSTKTVSLKKSETVASYAIDSGGNFSTLTTILNIKRNYPANNTIIGTPIVLVVISTFSLLFDDNFTPRITLCGAAMTTIIMHWAGIYNKVQPVATLLWLDNWMFGNLIAVGCIILYTAIRHHVCKHYTEKEKAAEQRKDTKLPVPKPVDGTCDVIMAAALRQDTIPPAPEPVNDKNDVIMDATKNDKVDPSCHKAPKKFVILDVIVSILIPIAYILFAVIYVWQWQMKEYKMA